MKAWTVDLYGEWLILVSFCNFASLLHLGIPTFMSHALRGAYAKKDWQLYYSIQHSALVVLTLLSALGFVIFVVISQLSFATWLHLNLMTQHNATSVLLLLASVTLLSLPTTLISGVYRSLGQLGRGQWWQNALVITRALLTFVLLMQKQAPWTLAVSWLGANMLFCGLMLLDQKRRLPQFVAHYHKATLESSTKLLLQGLAYFAATWGPLCVTEGTIIILSMFGEAKTIAQFASMRTFCNLLLQGVAVVLAALAPEITNLYAQQQKQVLALLFRKTFAYVLGASLVACVVMLSLGPWVLATWLQKNITIDSWLLLFLISYIFIQIISSVYNAFTITTFNHRAVNGYYVCTSIIGLVFGALVLRFSNMYGFIMTLGIFEIVGLKFFLKPAVQMTFNGSQSQNLV